MRGSTVHTYMATTCASIFGLPPCLGEWLSLCADVGNVHVLCAVLETKDGKVPHTEGQLLYHDCHFHITP